MLFYVNICVLFINIHFKTGKYRLCLRKNPKEKKKKYTTNKESGTHARVCRI